MERARLARLIRSFRKRTIAVFGDFMLDELLRGEATRISPEAPVPVVLIGHPHAGEGYPGGAGNVAANITSLGGRAVPFGVTGRDASAKQLRELLNSRGIRCETLLAEGDRTTPRKVRIVAHQHQLLRLDFEHPRRLGAATARRLVRAFAARVRKLDALVISDYQKGTVTTELCGEMAAIARQRRIPIFVDPKPEHPEICRNATVVTPNLHAMELMAGLPLRDRRSLELAGRRLVAELNCRYLLVKRSEKGVMLFGPGGEVCEIASVPRPVYDVTGAGDTVIAALALAFTSGATMREAAELANLAGGSVVLKFGTAGLTPDELLAAAGRAPRS
jgi:D-beta-D-heptose 7-phosphate kinase/D-beta-D-heptose 1-phosphate adenosyltransferase